MNCPVILLEAYVAAIPRLRAERSLWLAEAVAVGSGSMKKTASSSTIRSWQRQVRHRRAHRPKNLQSRLDAARALGIAVRVSTDGG